MSSVSIGITAMELFAYNPFRILGIPVNASHAEISATYNKLIKLAEQGDITAYKTPYDFDSLPPFSRSAQTVKTAYAKLASNGYRCFAYADSDFSVSLNIDDIILNLRDITCYDCFLRCYMWLIINDREMKEHSLWIELANYIDKLITSKPEEWTKYFDNRFPEEMVDPNMNAYKSFYSTFCEIILLPIKEMVRGSMKCRSAKEILQCAGIDVNAPIESFDVRQANAPQAGQSKPKLAKALKYGDEYFDISSGTMHKYDTTTAANESNSFQDSFSTPLSAESIISDTPAESELQPAPAQFAQPQQQASASQQIAPAAAEQSVPSRRSRRMENQPEEVQPAAPKATEPVAPMGEPLTLDNQQSSAPFFNPAPQQAAPQQPQRQPGQPRQRRSVKFNDDASSQPAQQPVQEGEFNSQNPFFDLQANKVQGAQDKAGTAHRSNSFSKIVEQTEKNVQAASQAEQEAREKAEMEDENYFTKALIEALQSSTRNKNMQSVDTSHVVSAAEMAGPSHTTASMDNIDMRRYDETNLMSQDSSNKKLSREQRYRDVKIDDMLGSKVAGKNYGLSPIEEFKIAKKKEVEMRKSIMFTIGVVTLVIAIALGLSFGGIL